MNLVNKLGSLILLGWTVAAFAQDTSGLQTNDARQVDFAERVVTIELVRALSPSVRKARETCSSACPETGALELAIGLIGISRTNKGSDALVNLLGLRLDGAGSEELNCQVLIRGAPIRRRLQTLNAERIVQHCHAIFHATRKRELSQIVDVETDRVCRSEIEILSLRKEYLRAIDSKAKCDQEQ
jgi:hypothetical protein